jgi:hypothetical protein
LNVKAHAKARRNLPEKYRGCERRCRLFGKFYKNSRFARTSIPKPELTT